MDERLRAEVAAWLNFYYELGIEEFNPRPAVRAGVPERREMAASPGSGTAEGEISNSRFQIPEAGERRTPNPESRTPVPSESRIPAEEERGTADSGFKIPEPSETRTPVLPGPGVPAHALNLFEAPSPKRAGRETLEQIRQDLGDCHRCRLAAGRQTIVFGQGNAHAELVLVGEGPGADEDEQGLPFVGRAGQLLNRMLQFVAIRREDVYICNIVKCRPPGNRVPERDEVESCSPFLFRQIQSIQPRLVCCLGAPAVKTLLGAKEGILKIRGTFYDFGGAKALATVHPAYVLRNPREEKILREDFVKIRDFLARR